MKAYAAFVMITSLLFVASALAQSDPEHDPNIRMGQTQLNGTTVHTVTNIGATPRNVVYAWDMVAIFPNEVADGNAPTNTKDDLLDVNWVTVAAGQTIMLTNNGGAQVQVSVWSCAAPRWPYDAMMGKNPKWNAHSFNHKVTCAPKEPIGTMLP